MIDAVNLYDPIPRVDIETKGMELLVGEQTDDKAAIDGRGDAARDFLVLTVGHKKRAKRRELPACLVERSVLRRG
jgi:hypothetical protein